MPLRKATRVVLVCSLAYGTLGCAREDLPPGTSPPRADEREHEVPPPITVTATRKDLVFSYPREDGSGFTTATSVDAIPGGSRRTVVVTDLSLTPEERQSGKFIYIADLLAPREDGSYPVALASRYGFEAKVATSTRTGAHASGAREVIVYSASWCGVCMRAKHLLKSLGVPFTEKDIEASRSAAIELREKAEAAGFQPGGVPVIDVGGTLLQGLDEPTLRALLRQKGWIK